jgi:hypothetical protein
MKKQWIIQCVGASEEDQAHLRLLLRSARKHVSEDWVWGPESGADLLMLDRHSPIGDLANAPLSDALGASQRGVASAQLIEAAEPAPAGLFLRRPFQRDAFAALLNDVAHCDIAEPVAETAAKSDEPEHANENVALVATQGSPSGNAPQNAPRAESEPDLPPSRATEHGVDENVMRSLLHYLPKRVLGGPAQIALSGAPPLVIDPDARMFWADGILPLLEPYVRQQLRLGDWKRLTNDELEQARQGSAARPYAQLIWVDGFIHSNGSLSRRFDPEGTYHLSKRLDLSNDYPRALRISAVMNNPRKLDAIARASGADLAEVFDVVNAYEAIGYLEWTRPGAARKT